MVRVILHQGNNIAYKLERLHIYLQGTIGKQTLKKGSLFVIGLLKLLTNYAN